MSKFGWPDTLADQQPLAIAHRGASGHRTENSLAAFDLASELFAEMWELDLRLSNDGIPVVSHDDNLARVTGRGIRISESSWEEISSVGLPDGSCIPRLEEVIELARTRGAGLYIEAKSEGSGRVAWQVLAAQNFSFAVIGSFNASWMTELRNQGCPYPLSVLVPNGADPFVYCGESEPDIFHFCWRDASATPHELVTKRLIDRCHLTGAAIVLWHEDRREVLDGLAHLPILGICSDRPETLKPYLNEKRSAPDIVCHRGANYIAPENTREAIRLCMDQNFQFAEIDVRTTADDKLVVIHDATLDRTTNGVGPISSHSLAEIRSLDAGGWKASGYRGLRVPTLSEVLDMCIGRIGVYIEIKDAEPRDVLSEVLKRNMIEQVFFWCWDREVLHEIRRIESRAQLMATRRNYSSLQAAVSDYDANIVEFEIDADDLDEIAICRSLGIKSMIFSLTQDLTKLSEILRATPDLINVDRPDLIKVLHSYPGLAHAHGKTGIFHAA